MTNEEYTQSLEKEMAYILTELRELYCELETDFNIDNTFPKYYQDYVKCLACKERIMGILRKYKLED